MHYYNFNIADYRKDTGHLSTLEHGIYRQLIDWYYLDERPIPAETQVVMRRLRLGSESDAVGLQNVLSEFFELRETGYHQPRCDAEIRDYHHKSAVNARNGKLGGRPKKTQSVIFAFDSESESKPNQKATTNHKPITNNHNKNTKNTSAIAPPDGVSESVWADFCQHRKTKKAKLTQTAMDGIKREADKAGWPIEAALAECCARGWTGFKAEWVADKSKAAPSETAYQRSMRERVAEFSPSIARQAPGAYTPENTILEFENVPAIASN